MASLNYLRCARNKFICVIVSVRRVWFRNALLARGSLLPVPVNGHRGALGPTAEGRIRP